MGGTRLSHMGMLQLAALASRAYVHGLTLTSSTVQLLPLAEGRTSIAAALQGRAGHGAVSAIHTAVRPLSSRRSAQPRAVATGVDSQRTQGKGGVAYDFAEVEGRWQKFWEDERTFATRRRTGKEKKYVLDMFPYPSGAGLHVGHPEGYTASDIMSRYWRMRDFDVLHPMGWDAFGLPAEQHAVATGTHPADTTKANIANFKRQLKSLGFSYDWERELATTDEDYVKWTQWIFLQLFKQGLAFQSQVSVNWCADLGTVLANEEVIDGKSERGDFPVERMPLRQWVLQITAMAEQLALELEGLDWPEGTITMQRAWIGKSEGAEIAFEMAETGEELRAFTTRPDTLMGVTYVVVSPEHAVAAAAAERDSEQSEAVRSYVEEAKFKSDMERTIAKEKTGVWSGMHVLHPISGEKLPLWIGDYVLATYGTGVVMAVPAHDERDFAFAEKYGLPMRTVVRPTADADADDELKEAFTDMGVCVNSGDGLDGLSTEECKSAMVEKLVELNKGDAKVTYKLRDWVFSRQRYWGEPIPIYFPVAMEDPAGDPRKGDAHTIDFDTPIAVPEDQLPVSLPDLDDFKPGNDPQGCLARVLDWRFFQQDGEWFARETNTMPQWAGSCWYYLRFADPANSEQAWSAEAEKSWLPVDLYVGGAEHAVLHLLYARFWHKVLFSLGLVSTNEPFQKLVHQGMILGSDGEKMSKSRGNVVNPDDIVGEFGADAMRLYEMFMGPLEAVKPWQTEQISGVVRFQNRVYTLAAKADTDADAEKNPLDEETQRIMHQTIRKVTHDYDALSFNTAISALMVFSNHLQSLKQPPAEALRALVLLVSPMAPHLGEEAWRLLGNSESLAYAPWPQYDDKLCEEATVNMAVQVNGKVRATIRLAKDAGEADAKELALADEKVLKFVEGKEIKKFIYVPGRIVNIVAK